LAATLARSDRPAVDRRAQKTRAAIIEAFNRLVLTRGFDAITPTVLADAANVGRSTFYEHFANVEEVLASRLGRLVAPLAASCAKAQMDPETTGIVQHMWDNRKIARAMFVGGGHTVVARCFAEHYEAALADLRSQRGVKTPVVAPKLAAAQLAAGSIAMLSGWLSGQGSGSAGEIAFALHAGAHALAGALSAEMGA
jgi:AcrR family transcriptional regulator